MLYKGVVMGIAASKHYTGYNTEPLQVKSCKFLKRELTPESWEFYKQDTAAGVKFYKDNNGSFYGCFAGDNPETSLFFIGDDLGSVIVFLLWR